MADNSRIEWTQATWNPVTGCDKVSTTISSFAIPRRDTSSTPQRCASASSKRS
ncbi:MAG: DUF5131 family protein [Arthrospira platensis]